MRVEDIKDEIINLKLYGIVSQSEKGFILSKEYKTNEVAVESFIENKRFIVDRDRVTEFANNWAKLMQIQLKENDDKTVEDVVQASLSHAFEISHDYVVSPEQNAHLFLSVELICEQWEHKEAFKKWYYKKDPFDLLSQ